MSFSLNENPFRLHVRPDPGADDALVVRFEVNDGMGVLALRKVGREEPQPTMHYEETEVEAEYLRAGRFVHVLGSGQRQSYALSRVTAELIRRLPVDAWTELKPVTEYGFRYLVIPEEALTTGSAAVAVAVAAGATATSEGAGARVATAAPAAVEAAVEGAPPVRPAPVAKVGAAVPSASLPPRQVPMEPALAEAALQGLDRDAAVKHLRGQMAKVEVLHQRVMELEAALQQSKSREQDLLQVLARWQQM